MTNKVSQLNLQRLRSDKLEHVKERDDFFEALKTNEETAKKVRAMIQKIAGIFFAIDARTRALL